MSQSPERNYWFMHNKFNCSVCGYFPTNKWILLKNIGQMKRQKRIKKQMENDQKIIHFVSVFPSIRSTSKNDFDNDRTANSRKSKRNLFACLCMRYTKTRDIDRLPTVKMICHSPLFIYAIDVWPDQWHNNSIFDSRIALDLIERTWTIYIYSGDDTCTFHQIIHLFQWFRFQCNVCMHCLPENEFCVYFADHLDCQWFISNLWSYFDLIEPAKSKAKIWFPFIWVGCFPSCGLFFSYHQSKGNICFDVSNGRDIPSIYHILIQFT